MSNPVKEFERSLSAQRVTDRFAMEFPTDEALKKYLKDHPDADRSKHTVKKDEGGSKSKKSEDFTPGKEHHALGGELQQWHGPGTPALNEVGSHLTGGKPFPRKRLEEAARELEKMKDHPSSTDKDKRDLDALVMKLWRMDR
jgi:hypothetical protein